MQNLYTEEGRVLPDIPWNQYPRPQMEREDWLCLNGEWEFQIEGGQKTTICVPFCPESLLSGISFAPKTGENLFYRRSFRIPNSWAGKHILLHFGAVSRLCTVFVNGKPVCRHDNGFLPFTVDITEILHSDENELSLSVVNDLSLQYPLGKQRAERGGMWYTPCSGIWQTVWLEPVPEQYITGIRILTGLDWADIELSGVSDGLITLEDRQIPVRNGRAHIDLSNARTWSPEDPVLYYFSVCSGEDRITSYFALRTLSTEFVNGIPRLCLNGRPYFFHGLLDQGYWSDGLYTPASPVCFEKDILAMKSLGFNTLRKHIKIEPAQFYYDCDRLGMVVFQDMVNNGEYRYIRDTLLPNFQVQKRDDHRLNPDPVGREIFLSAMEETVCLLGNHPSIVLWTIFNEGWGQFCADECYQRMKALDESRFTDSTSGWFHQRESDVDSLHIYFQKLHLGSENRPQLLSEFGGYVWKDPIHSFNPDKTYGYRKFPDRQSFVKGIRRLYEEEVLPLVSKGLCGAIYTQVSDVEDETNGLFTFDRAVLKIRPDELRDLSKKLQEALGGQEHNADR